MGTIKGGDKLCLYVLKRKKKAKPLFQLCKSTLVSTMTRFQMCHFSKGKSVTVFKAVTKENI